MSEPTRYFDSHLHLTAERLRDDRADVLDRARAAGVVEMVTIATDPEDAAACRDLAAAEPGIWATAGLHPHEASHFSPDCLQAIEALAGDPHVVAIGEAGLDYHYDHGPRRLQLESFESQLELAARTGLPIIVHSREAEDDTAALIQETRSRVRGVLHCFTSSLELLETGLSADWFVSFSGIVTFVTELEEAVRRVPGDRLLIETDSPYLAPVPRRGRRNEPSFLPHTCEALAAIRSEAPEAMAERTRRNARTFYGLE